MKLGTDISLKTCNEEGYTIMDYKVRELFPDGRKQTMDRDCCVEFYACAPLYLRPSFATKQNPFGSGKMWSVHASWNDLVERFEYHKANICSCCGQSTPELLPDDPDEHDLLNLADVINSYCGLE